MLAQILGFTYRIYSKERLCSKEHPPFEVKYLMSAPLFSQNGRSFEKWYLKGALIWELHTKNSIIQLILLVVLFFFCK